MHVRPLISLRGYEPHDTRYTTCLGANLALNDDERPEEVTIRVVALECTGDLKDGSDQADSIDQHVLDYQARLSFGGLPHIPFHMADLLHSHGDYEGMDLGSRKGLFSRFGALVRRLPITYHTFAYSSYDVAGETLLSARMRFRKNILKKVRSKRS